jgi:hypothetical protein
MVNSAPLGVEFENAAGFFFLAYAVGELILGVFSRLLPME